jgi:hypothetical protein
MEACASTVENCFNGIDDNCNGLVDCADPMCTGGTTPIAECVPDPGAALSGTLSTSTCPASYPTATALYAGMVAGTCAGGTCSCLNGLNGPATCSAVMRSEGGAAGCAIAGTVVFNMNDTAGCFSFSTLSSTTYYDLFAPTLNATCNPTTGGNPIKNPPTWSQTNQFRRLHAADRGSPRVREKLVTVRPCPDFIAHRRRLHAGSDDVRHHVDGGLRADGVLHAIEQPLHFGGSHPMTNESS